MKKKFYDKETILKHKGGVSQFGQRPYFYIFFWDPSLNDNRYICIKNEEPLDEIKVLDHIMIQYVDDSNNLITTDDITHIEQYINKYFRLIEGYYNLNKLKINPDRSEIMIICKPN